MFRRLNTLNSLIFSWLASRMILLRLECRFTWDTWAQSISLQRSWNLSFTVSETRAVYTKWNCSSSTSTSMAWVFSRWIKLLTFTWRSSTDQITSWIQCFLNTTRSSMLFSSIEYLGKLLKREFILWSLSVPYLILIFRHHLKLTFWDNSIFPSFTSSCQSQFFTWLKGRTH